MAKITLNEKEKELDIDLWIIMIVSSPRSVKIASSPPFEPLKRLSLVDLPSVNNITAVRRQQV